MKSLEIGLDAFRRKHRRAGWTVDQWLLELTEQNAPALAEAAPARSGQALIDVCAEIRCLLSDAEIDAMFARN